MAIDWEKTRGLFCQHGNGLNRTQGAPVTPAELTPLPFHRATPEDLEVLDRLQTGPPPSLPPVPNGFTDEQRYLFDTHGAKTATPLVS